MFVIKVNANIIEYRNNNIDKLSINKSASYLISPQQASSTSYLEHIE